MANVWAKVKQAAFFLHEMEHVQADREKFIYELSAFLSACQSVAYFLAKLQPKGWYKELLRRADEGEFPRFAFYYRKRHQDVHEEALDVLGMSSVTVNGELPRPVEEYYHFIKKTRDADGNLVSFEYDDGSGSPHSYEFTEEHRYFFRDADMTEQDILAGCVEYLMELRRIVGEVVREHGR